MAPVITSLSAAPQNTNQGSYGQTLTINGTGMVGATQVRLGTRSVTATPNVGGTIVTCTLPSGCGPVNVTVVAPSGVSNPLPFYFIGSPFVSASSPDEGSATAPPLVVLQGETLLTTNQVQFNAVTATLTPPTSDASVSATPAAIAELGAAPWFQILNAAVRTAGGTFTFPNAVALFDEPTITTLSPATGAAGTEVIVTGTGFVGSDISVTFDGVDADVTPLSDTQLIAIAPTGPVGAVDVVVTTPGGSSAAETFTYA